jgi:DNA-directed RNA polymerase beta' subunit
MDTATYNAITAIENRAEDHHERVRATLDEELADYLDEVKCVKDMYLTEFERDCEKKREKLKEQIKAFKERVVDEVDKYENAMLEKIEKMKTAAAVEMQLRHEFVCT